MMITTMAARRSGSHAKLGKGWACPWTVLEAFRISDFLNRRRWRPARLAQRGRMLPSPERRGARLTLSDGWRKAIDAVHSFFGRIGTSKERIALRPSQPLARRVYQPAALP